MPLYEYSCPSCGFKFEELKRMDERLSARCPKCGATAEKALSSFAAVVGDGGGSGGNCGSDAGSCCSCGSGNCQG